MSAWLCWRHSSLVGTAVFTLLALLAGGLLPWLQIEGIFRLRRTKAAYIANCDYLVRDGTVESIRCRPLAAVRTAEESTGCFVGTVYHFFDVGENVILCVGYICGGDLPNEDFELLRIPGRLSVLDVISLGKPTSPVRVIPPETLPRRPDRAVFDYREMDESPGEGATVFTFPGSLETLESDLRRFLASKPKRNKREYL